MPSIMGAFTSKFKHGFNVLDFFRIKSATGIGGDSSVKNDPDERWSNLYRERQRNHLYKWVDVTKGGQLLEIYDKEGDEGVVRFANDVIAPLLYNDGTLPEKIRLNDYLKWKKAVNSNLAGGDDLMEEGGVEGTGVKFEEHMAQWRLNKRGVEGETIVHLLLARDDAKCTEIAKILVRVYPCLAADIYENTEMYGQSPLHLAIVHDDYDCVNVLLNASADINQRATGRFFLPEDQKRVPKVKQTNYAGFAYFGEYPLAFAASFGSKDIFDLLIQNGADPNKQDSFGNTVLHICVINNSIEMYSYAVRHWEKPADVNVCNLAGYTPLTLATILGRREIFEAMLELMKVEFWRFSDMACSAYPLTTVDTIRPDGSTNWDSALMRVINGTTAGHLDIVGCEVIQRLLADKWRAFGYKKMYERLAFLILHLLTMSVAIYIRPDDASDLLGRNTPQDIFRYCTEAATLIGCLVFLVYQQGGEIRAQGWRGYLRSLRRGPDKVIFLIVNVLLLLCVPCRFLEMYDIEESFLAIALPGSWSYLLFFAKGYLLTGPFVIMIYSMIAGDMVRFGIISLIFLVSFSQAFFFLGKDITEKQAANQCIISRDDHVILNYDTYPETVITLFRMSMGGYDYEEFDCAAYPVLTKMLFVLYMIIMPIMLINMLIAMMGNTYTTVISQAEKAWRQQWAQIVIVLERAINPKKLAKYQLEYSIKLSEDSANQTETRGLMVIKQTKKTRAKQRKQATSSWKRLSRKVLAMLRNHGNDRARDMLHSHGQMVLTRPQSAAGLAHNHHLLAAHIQQPSFSGAVRKAGAMFNQPSIMDRAAKVVNVVNSLRGTPTMESPQFLVHRLDVPTAETPYPNQVASPPNPASQFTRRMSESLASKLPDNIGSSDSIMTLVPAASAGSAEPRWNRPPTGSALQKLPNDPETLDAVKKVDISSPCSPANSPSNSLNGYVINGDSGPAPPPAKRRNSERVSPGSIQLQPLSVEQLPRNKGLRSTVAGGHLTKAQQPNVPPPPVSGAGLDERRSQFQRSSTAEQLPNIPLHLMMQMQIHSAPKALGVEMQKAGTNQSGPEHEHPRKRRQVEIDLQQNAIRELEEEANVSNADETQRSQGDSNAKIRKNSMDRNRRARKKF